MKKLMIGAVCAIMAAVTFAEPSVKINKAYQKVPGSGIVDYTYTVSGLKGVTDLFIEVGAEGCAKTVVLTNLNVTVGTVTTQIDVKKLLGKAYPNVTLFAELEDAVQLWENGPYFAKANIGATKPEEYGYYFWWGDTVGYKRNAANNGWVSVKDGSAFQFTSENCKTWNKDNALLRQTGWIDVLNGNLVATHDAATAHLGAPWRMMTKDELDKLVSTDYCRMEWVTEYKGVTVSGWVVKGKAGSAYENNEVFFPAVGNGSDSSLVSAGSTGYYWSSTPYSDNSNYAQNIFSNSSKFIASISYRYNGMTVRPVRDAK